MRILGSQQKYFEKLQMTFLNSLCQQIHTRLDSDETALELSSVIRHRHRLSATQSTETIKRQTILLIKRPWLKP